MKCEKCFFCTTIGRGIYADYPIKFCKFTKECKIPFVSCVSDEGVLTTRKLDFSDMKDCKIWHDVGCNIHPATVAKAKREFIRKMEDDLK